mgnify:CR=1 FL=1
MFPIETISARMLDYYVGRNDALIIDLREEKAYAESHVRGAVNIPYETLENRKNLPMNKILVFYCDRGGYRTRSVIGGFTAYRGRNLVSGDR